MNDTRVLIEAIRIVGRHRREFGDVQALAEDIRINGLIHAVALTADNQLVAGERRLRAVRLLGWTEVPVRYLDNLADAAAVLHAERSENTQRLDMAPSELASLGSAIEALEKPKARERKVNGGVAGRAIQTGQSAPRLGTGSRPAAAHAGETTAKVADALGVSDATYRRMRAVHNAATDESLPELERARAQGALDEMDRTDTVQPVYSRWRAGEVVGAPSEAVPAGESDEPKAEGRTRNRKALPDSFRDATYQLTRAVERVERLVLDDRFTRNAEQVARISRNDLLRAADLLAAVIGRIPNPYEEG